MGAVITAMRAGPGGSTEQKRAHTAVGQSRGWPAPTALWERAGTSCPRSPGLPPEKIQLPGPEVTWTVLALALPEDIRGAKDPVLPLQAAAAKREGPEQQAEGWPWAPTHPAPAGGVTPQDPHRRGPRRRAAQPRLEGKTALMANVFREVSHSSYLGEQAAQWVTSGLGGHCNRRQLCSLLGAA